MRGREREGIEFASKVTRIAGTATKAVMAFSERNVLSLVKHASSPATIVDPELYNLLRLVLVSTKRPLPQYDHS